MIIIFLFALFILKGEESISLFRKIDWEKGMINIHVVESLKDDCMNIPNNQYLKELEIRRKIPDLFLNSILDLKVDSINTVDDLIKKDFNNKRKISEIALKGTKENSYKSNNMKDINVTYSYPLIGEDGLISVFIEHSVSNPIKRNLGFYPTRKFSGLVIYAQGEYPAYGKNRKEYIQPCLFPTIYDEDMNIILDRWMCNPDFLKGWGMVKYTYSSYEKPHTKRIGLNPLRTMAIKVFGKHSTDIILPQDATRRLLLREDNRKLLTEGRILVIINKE